jgi:rhodanese-related sulfurtransferase
MSGGDSPLLIDVRTVEEFQESHIGGSLNVPLDELPAKPPVDWSEARVVFVCRSGRRSKEALDRLGAQIDRAFNLDGGMLAWAEQGLPAISRG